MLAVSVTLWLHVVQLFTGRRHCPCMTKNGRPTFNDRMTQVILALAKH